MNNMITTNLFLLFLFSTLVKWILLKNNYEVSLISDHHKDPIRFIKLIKKEKDVKKKIGYVILFLCYVMSFIKFVVFLFNELRN